MDSVTSDSSIKSLGLLVLDTFWPKTPADVDSQPLITSDATDGIDSASPGIDSASPGVVISDRGAVGQSGDGSESSDGTGDAAAKGGNPNSWPDATTTISDRTRETGLPVEVASEFGSNETGETDIAESGSHPELVSTEKSPRPYSSDVAGDTEDDVPIDKRSWRTTSEHITTSQLQADTHKAKQFWHDFMPDVLKVIDDSSRVCQFVPGLV